MAEERVEYEKLGRAGLRFVDVVAQTVGFMGPVFGSILLIALVVGANNAGKGAGVATPFAILIAAIGVAALGWIIAAYARRIHAAGALYDYVSAGFGERTGFVFGWIYLGGLIVLSVAIPLLIGGLTSDFLKGAYNIGIPYWLLDIVYCVILFSVLYFGVRLSTRAQLALVLFSASVVTVFILYIIVKGGHGGNSFKPFNPSEAGGFGNLFYGVLYAILLFVGFESAANLGGLTPPKLPVRYLDDQILEVPKSIRLATPHCTDGEATRAAGLEVFVREARGTEEKAPRDIRVASKGSRRPVLVRGRRERRVDARTFAADTVALGRIEDRHQFVDGR